MAKTVIVVGVTEVDGYGNLLVTAKEGGQVKISKKREHLFPLFQQGKAVELDWQTYNNNDYVANARLVEDALPGKVEPPTDMTPPKAPVIKTDSKNRAFALSYAKDYCIAKMNQGVKVKVTDVVSTAVIFESYLDSGAVIEYKEQQ